MAIRVGSHSREDTEKASVRGETEAVTSSEAEACQNCPLSTPLHSHSKHINVWTGL